MKKLDWWTFILTGLVSLAIGGIFVNFIYGNVNLPSYAQTGLFLMLSSFVMLLSVLFSIFVFTDGRRGYLYEYKNRHFNYALRVIIIFVAVAAVLGVVTEVAYTFSGHYMHSRLNRAGSYIVADYSGSMNVNDEHGEMKNAIAEYIRGLDSNELFGITLYSDNLILPVKPYDMSDMEYNLALQVFENYTFLEDSLNRENIIRLIQDTPYDGGTNTNDALITALTHIRNAESSGNYVRMNRANYYPAEVFLFSDGVPTTPMEYSSIHRLSVSGRIIPISTVFYGSPEAEGVENMRRIAKLTGGIFTFVAPHRLNSVFVDISDHFKFENPRLLFPVVGALSHDTIRMVLQWFLLFSWILFSSIAVYNLIGSKDVKNDLFRWKFIWSGFVLVLAVIFINSDYSMLHTVGRIFVAFSFALVFPLHNRELKE